MKNSNEDEDVVGDSRKRYRCPWAEIGKYRPRKEPFRLQDSLPCPQVENYTVNEIRILPQIIYSPHARMI